MIWEIVACVGCFFGGMATNYISAIGFKHFLTVYTEKAEALAKKDLTAWAEKVEAFADKSEVAIRREASQLVADIRSKI